MIQSFVYFILFLSWTNNFIFIDGFVSSSNPKSRITTTTTTRTSFCGVSRRHTTIFQDESIHDNELTKQENHIHSTTSCINHNIMNRRKAMLSPLVSLVCGMSLLQQQPANAVITDETDNFGDNWWAAPSTPTTNPRSSTSSPQAQQSTATTTPSDEITIRIPKSDLQSKQGLGIELGEIEFRTNRRVYIKSVLSGSVADKLGIKKDWVVVSVNGDVRSKKRRLDVENPIIRSF